MNKIIVEEEKFIANNTQAFLEFKNSFIKITCYGHNQLFIKNKENLNLDITLEDNSVLDIFIYEKNKKATNKVIITQKNGTSINYIEAFTSEEKTTIDIINKVLGNNNKSNLKLRCISNQESIEITILAYAEKMTKNNEITEDVKGINNGGQVIIKPDLEINTEDIMANHLVTISSIPASYLFYLEAKGIDIKTCKKIILKGFLESIFNAERKTMFGGEDNE